MKQQDKFYNFLKLFNDCQEKAIYAIRDLAGCKYRTAKIRTIVTNVRFDGINENFSEIENYIDIINNMVNNGYDISKFNQDTKYKDLNDDEIFKIEELDEIGLSLYVEEMSLLGIDKKPLEYLYYRETSLKEKANKEIIKLNTKIFESENKIRNLNKEIIRLKAIKNIKEKKKKLKVNRFNQLSLF